MKIINYLININFNQTFKQLLIRDIIKMDNRKRKHFTLEGKYNAIVAVDSKKKTQNFFYRYSPVLN